MKLKIKKALTIILLSTFGLFAFTQPQNDNAFGLNSDLQKLSNNHTLSKNLNNNDFNFEYKPDVYRNGPSGDPIEGVEQTGNSANETTPIGTGTLILSILGIAYLGFLKKKETK